MAAPLDVLSMRDPLTSAPVVLLIHADTDHRAHATAALQAAGLSVVVALPQLRSELLMARVRPDLVLLDPGPDAGLKTSVAAVLDTTDAPVIVLSDRSSGEDVAATLGAGARDHIAVPCNDLELIARVLRALRDGGRDMRGEQPLVVGDLELRLAERKVWIAGVEARLTTVEFELLRVLASQPGTVFHRTALLRLVWGHQFGDSSTVAVHIRRLRAKIEKDPADPVYLRTQWGVGYWLAARDGGAEQPESAESAALSSPSRNLAAHG